VTKYCKKIFNASVYGFFWKRLGEIHEYYSQIEFIEQKHDKDHIHLLSILPKMKVGSVVCIIKFNTARDLKKT